MFGLKHVILLLCSIALIVGIVVGTRKWSLRKRSKAFMFVGLISETVKIFFYIVKNESKYGGILPKTDLPFQLCSIQILFILAVMFTKNDKIRRVLLAFMLPSGLIGGSAALLIPTSSSLNYWVITVQYFLYHIALISFAIGLILDKEFVLTIRDYFSCLVFIFGLMFFSIYINSIVYDGVTEVNFMYVVSPPVEGLPYLTEEHGWLTYICHYAALIFVAITACYIKPIVNGIKEYRAKFKAKRAEES